MADSTAVHLRILLVEHSSDDAQLIALQLEQDGLDVEYRRADNETEFTAALNWTPDLILSEYSLPGFDVLQALCILKEQNLNIPLIIVASAVGEDVIMEAIKRGAEDYVMKDRPARLGFAIQRALEQKRLQTESARTNQALRDITKRKPAKGALHPSEAQLELFFSQSLDGFFFMMLDEPVMWNESVDKEQALDYLLAHQHITKVNNAMLEQYGATEKQFLGLTPNDLFAHNIEQGRITFRELFDAGHLHTYTDERRFDGSQIWIEGDYICLYDMKGRITGHFGIQRDVTESKRAEESLRKAEMKFRSLTEQIPPIVYIAGQGQHIGVSYISPRISILGYTVEEWLADPELWFRQIHPDDQNRILDEIRKCELNHLPFREEYRIAGRDGSIKWFLDEAMDIFDEDGSHLFRQGFMLDITKRKQAEETLASREHYLALLNAMTRNILLSTDFDSTLHTLAFDLKKIIDADDCYILRWNEERQLPIPVTTTASLDFPFNEAAFSEKEFSATASILEAGRVVAVEDVVNSPALNIEIIKRYPAHSIIVIPLIAGNHKLGVALIAFNSHHSFTKDEIERTTQAGNQVALALWNFQQSLEIQQRLRESNALTEIGRLLGATEHVGTGEVLQLIVDSTRELIHQAEESVIHILDVEEQALIPKAVSGFDNNTKTEEPSKMRLGEGIAGQVMSKGSTLNVGDINTSPYFLIKDTRPTFRSLLVAPVHSGKQRIGTISVQSGKLNAFSVQDEELLNALSIQAAIAIENTRLFENTQQGLKEVNALYKISQGLAASLNADELIEDVVMLLQNNFQYYHAQIYLLDPLTGDLVLKRGSGSAGAQLLEQSFRLQRGVGIIGHVGVAGKPFLTNNVKDTPFFMSNPLLPETQSELVVPIKVDEQVVGILDIQQKSPHRLAESDLQLMTAVADQLSVALQKASLYTNLQTALQQEQTVRSQLLQSERLALVGRLLASVSHELNNPLQAIQNALFLLKDETILSNQAKQDLDIILAEAERMAALIERLRSAYRPVRIRDFQPMDLNNLIEDVHALIATHMRHKEIAFEFHPDSDLPDFWGVADQMRQVALNLFLNAIEVMKPGGRLTVETRFLHQQDEILFTVQDTGPGIDAEILPHIFDPFITSKHTGTGIGLTITQDIIQQHHGRIEAANNPTGGATFKVWLPITSKGD